MIRADKDEYLARDYELAVKRRDYPCPHCRSGRLVGHVVRPKTQHLALDRYLFPMLVPKVRLTVEGAPSPYRGLGRFNLLFCPRCYLLIEGPPQLQNGEVQVERLLRGFYLRTDGKLPEGEGGVTFGELFWARIHKHAHRLAGADWFTLAAADGLIADKYRTVFQGKGPTFNALVDSLLLSDDPAERMGLLRKMDPMITNGMAVLVTRQAYRHNAVLFALYEFRLAQYAVMIGREARQPFQVHAEDEPVVRAAHWLLQLLEAKRPVPRSATGMLMMWSMRMRRFAPDRERLRWVRLVAWLASEHLVRKGQVNYNDPSYNPDVPYDNNEAVRYLNLVLREDLGFEEVTTRDTPDELRSQLTYGLNRCHQFSQGKGTPLQRRACRLGEQVAKLSVRHLPEGAVELLNPVAS